VGSSLRPHPGSRPEAESGVNLQQTVYKKYELHRLCKIPPTGSALHVGSGTAMGRAPLGETAALRVWQQWHGCQRGPSEAVCSTATDSECQQMGCGFIFSWAGACKL